MQVGFEPPILVFERAKTVHTLESAATVIGIRIFKRLKLTVSIVNRRQEF
jgi:hypothetical protein